MRAHARCSGVASLQFSHFPPLRPFLGACVLVSSSSLCAHRWRSVRRVADLESKAPEGLPTKMLALMKLIEAEGPVFAAKELITVTGAPLAQPWRALHTLGMSPGSPTLLNDA